METGTMVGVLVVGGCRVVKVGDGVAMMGGEGQGVREGGIPHTLPQVKKK